MLRAQDCKRHFRLPAKAPGKAHILGSYYMLLRTTVLSGLKYSTAHKANPRNYHPVLCGPVKYQEFKASLGFLHCFLQRVGTHRRNTWSPGSSSLSVNGQRAEEKRSQRRQRLSKASEEGLNSHRRGSGALCTCITSRSAEDLW